MLGFGGKIVAGVNSKVLLYAREGEGLKRVCGHFGHVAVLYMKTLGDYILVGDLMRCASLPPSPQNLDTPPQISIVPRFWRLPASLFVLQMVCALCV